MIPRLSEALRDTAADGRPSFYTQVRVCPNPNPIPNPNPNPNPNANPHQDAMGLIQKEVAERLLAMMTEAQVAQPHR